MSEHAHQFFKIRNIGYSPMGTITIQGKEQLTQYPYLGGALVMCALCGEQRQLWESGEILFFIDGAWRRREEESGPSREE